MALKLKEIADMVGGKLVGDPDVTITRVAPIRNAQPGEITFISNEKYVAYAKETKASAIIVSPDLSEVKNNLIVAENPYLAFAKTVETLMDKPLPRTPGTHPSAIVDPHATIGKDVSIGPNVVIEAGAVIGDRVTLRANVYVGHGVAIGADTVVHANASFYHGVQIGKRCIIHSSVALGTDGFGWAPNGPTYTRIPQVGNTILGDDVSIGAGTVINRGALGDTIIGSGTKIDSQVIISHNVEIGENCLLVSQVGVSGTVKIGNHVTLGGQVGVAGHLEIGDNVQVAAQSGVSRSLSANGVYFGSPARPMGHAKRTIAAIQKLPELRDEIKNVQKRMSEISALLDKDTGDRTKAATPSLDE